MSTATRIAVLGLYRSGTTAIAGALHHLGVDMGAPFWSPCCCFYEPADLAQLLRWWWNEPDLPRTPQRMCGVVSSVVRIGALRRWIEARERRYGEMDFSPQYLDSYCQQFGPRQAPQNSELAARNETLKAARLRQPSRNTFVGAKHPLLCISCHDVRSAWGPNVRYVRSWRALEDSIRSLARCGWFPDPYAMQRTLWTVAEEFFAAQPHIRIEFPALLQCPEEQILRLVDYLNLSPTAAQLSTASAWIRPK